MQLSGGQEPTTYNGRARDTRPSTRIASRWRVIFLAVLGLASCEYPMHNQTIELHKNGRKEFTIILDGESNDTLEKRSYHKNGRLLAIIPYQRNKWNGVIREYDDQARLVNKEGYIDAISIFRERHFFDQDGRDTVVRTYRRVDDDREYARDYLKILQDTVVRLESYGYKVFPEKDTVSMSEVYDFTLKFYTMHRDSAFHEVLIGSIDVDMNLIDTVLWQSGWEKEFKFSLNPWKTGYNFLFGKIKMIVLQPEDQSIGLDSAFFYTDFYVIE